MAHSVRSVFFTGVLMILAGAGLIVPQLLGAEWVYPLIPLAAGVGLVVAAFAARIPGFVLPGSLLGGAGAGIVLNAYVVAGGDRSETAVLAICLGVALAVSPLLSRLVRGTVRLWPLIPAAALVVIGLLILLFGGVP